MSNEGKRFVRRYLIKKTDKDLRETVNNIKGLSYKNTSEMLEAGYGMLNIDLLFLGSIAKLNDLIDPMIFAMEQNNITVAAALTRMAMDCCLRTYASSLVKDADDFVSKCILSENQINKYKDAKGKELSDRYLCEVFGTRFDLPIYDVYKKVCNYVHLSSRAFLDKAKVFGDGEFEFHIGGFSDNKEYTRICNELGQQFFFFSMVLIDFILVQWTKQKIRETTNENK